MTLSTNIRSNTPIVSVILPFYNRIAYTLESIESVINQTYSDWELLLIDDGATDDVSSICTLANKDPRIRLFHQKNKGVASARNYGISQASGKYIAFLDSDDLWMKNKLDEQLFYMRTQKAIFSHTSYERIRADKSLLGIVHSGRQRGNIYPNILSGCDIATPTVIMRREILTERPSPFPSSFHIGEDVCLWIDIAAAHKISGIDKPLARIRVDDTTAALDVEKQIIGLKNILAYIIQNPRYSAEYEHIDFLRDMIDELENDELQKQWRKYQDKDIENGVFWRLTRPYRLTQKAIAILKRDGPKKLEKKIRKKLNLL